jgi:hypothetical protein
VTEIFAHVRDSWSQMPLFVLTVGLIFGFAPGLMLNLGVLVFPKGHPRREELLAELEVVPFLKRAFWVFQALQITCTEGIPARVSAVRAARRSRDKITDTDSQPYHQAADQTKSGEQVEDQSGAVTNTDCYAPVATAAVPDEDFRARRQQHPDYDGADVGQSDAELDGIAGSLAITKADRRTAPGPQADAPTAQTSVEIVRRARYRFSEASGGEADDWVKFFNEDDVYAMIGTVRTVLGEPADTEHTQYAIPALQRAMSSYRDDTAARKAFDLSFLLAANREADKRPNFTDARELADTIARFYDAPLP